MQHFVINQAFSDEYKQAVSKRLAKMKLEAQFIVELKPQQLTENELAASPLTAEQIAHLLTHKKIYQQIVDESIEQAAILAAELQATATTTADVLIAIETFFTSNLDQQQATVLLLHPASQTTEHIQTISQDINILQAKNGALPPAYLLNLPAAKMLLEQADSLSLALDDERYLSSCQSLQRYCLNQPLFTYQPIAITATTRQKVSRVAKRSASKVKNNVLDRTQQNLFKQVFRFIIKMLPINSKLKSLLNRLFTQVSRWLFNYLKNRRK